MARASQGGWVSAAPGPAESCPKVPAVGAGGTRVPSQKLHPELLNPSGWALGPLLAGLCAHSSDRSQVPCCSWGPQPAQLLLQRFRKEIQARIMRFLSAQHFCSDTFLCLWAEDPNKMMVLFLSSRIILVASELLGASISQQKIEILCLSGNIFISLLKNNGSFILWPQQDEKSSTTTTGL